MDNVPEPLSVVCIDQSVSKHPVGFMKPQQSKVTGLSGGFGVSPHDALNDSCHISQVEGVMGL